MTNPNTPLYPWELLSSAELSDTDFQNGDLLSPDTIKVLAWQVRELTLTLAATEFSTDAAICAAQLQDFTRLQGNRAALLMLLQRSSPR